MPFRLSRSTRLTVVIGISTCFFLGEISVGFYTHSLALIADAFHYLNDLVGFIIALVALKVSEKGGSPQDLSFGWQRAQLLGAFFNGVLLFSLGISIFLQSIERFISLHRIENPQMVFIVGCIGLSLNLISALFLHEHSHGHSHASPQVIEAVISPISDCEEDSISKHRDHKHPRFETEVSAHCPDHDSGHGHSHEHDHGDLGMTGVLLHVLCDAANNLGVIAAALVIWLAKYDGRYYADPGGQYRDCNYDHPFFYSTGSDDGSHLAGECPDGVDLTDVQHDLEKVPGVHSIHELHIWRLNQRKTLASVHVVVSDPSVPNFLKTAKTINECFHAYGIHSATLQPEVLCEIASGEKGARCQVVCGAFCQALTCCG